MNMFRVILIALAFVCSGCLYPRYVGQKHKTYGKQNFLPSQDTLFVDQFYFSATRKKTGIIHPYETVSISSDIEQLLSKSLEHSNILIRTLENKTILEGLEGKK